MQTVAMSLQEYLIPGDVRGWWAKYWNAAAMHNLRAAMQLCTGRSTVEFKKSKAKLEPRPAPHEVRWANHRALPTPSKYRAKPGSQYRCIAIAPPEPDITSLGSTIGRPGLNFVQNKI